MIKQDQENIFLYQQIEEIFFVKRMKIELPQTQNRMNKCITKMLTIFQ